MDAFKINSVVILISPRPDNLLYVTSPPHLPKSTIVQTKSLKGQYNEIFNFNFFFINRTYLGHTD